MASPISQQMFEDVDPTQSINKVAEERNEFEGLEFTSEATILGDVAEGGELLGVGGEIFGVNNWMPHEGMQFSSEDEARGFYNEFAKRMGFSIRTESSKRTTPNGPVARKYYVCYKAGKKRTYEPKFKPLCDRLQRVGCKARMALHFKNGVWIIKSFINEHNHELFASPNKARKLRSHNKEHLLPKTRELMDQFKSAGCGPSKIARLLNATGIDENFYYTMELDKDGVCRSIFWADGKAREMYENFSDVVVFDVTYRTNKFNLPFAPFTGVNHHWQSTLFGCALLSDEQEDTFVWLFEHWLLCMGGKAPGAIIIDQDPAITNAIKKVFPSTRHRFCIWHITLHADEHLRSLRSSYNPGFDVEYYKWIKHSKTIVEAESAWKNLKEKYKKEFVEPLTDKQHNEKKSWQWLEKMYEQRYSWVDVYLRDTFFAGMRSTQRSESINSFFDGYVNSMTPLSEFFSQYAKALECRRDEEVTEDMCTMRAKPDPNQLHPLEVQVGKVYTRKVFEKFQNEIKACLYCVCGDMTISNEVTVYDVIYQFGNKVESHSVRCSPLKEEFACSCGKFETAGILCKHILHIMRQIYRMNKIPKGYILARWTLAYRQRSKQAVCELIGTTKDSMVSNLEVWNLRKSLNMVQERAIKHHDHYSAIIPLVEEMMNILDSVDKEHGSAVREQSQQNTSTEAISQGAVLCNITIRDPERVKTKGRPRDLTRIQSGKEVSQNAAQARRRTCSLCGIKGHDARTCRKTKGKRTANETTTQSPRPED